MSSAALQEVLGKACLFRAPRTGHPAPLTCARGLCGTPGLWWPRLPPFRDKTLLSVTQHSCWLVQPFPLRSQSPRNWRFTGSLGSTQFLRARAHSEESSLFAWLELCTLRTAGRELMPWDQTVSVKTRTGKGHMSPKSREQEGHKSPKSKQPSRIRNTVVVTNFRYF